MTYYPDQCRLANLKYPSAWTDPNDDFRIPSRPQLQQQQKQQTQQQITFLDQTHIFIEVDKTIPAPYRPATVDGTPTIDIPDYFCRVTHPLRQAHLARQLGASDSSDEFYVLEGDAIKACREILTLIPMHAKIDFDHFLNVLMDWKHLDRNERMAIKYKTIRERMCLSIDEQDSYGQMFMQHVFRTICEQSRSMRKCYKMLREIETQAVQGDRNPHRKFDTVFNEWSAEDQETLHQTLWMVQKIARFVSVDCELDYYSVRCFTSACNYTNDVYRGSKKSCCVLTRGIGAWLNELQSEFKIQNSMLHIYSKQDTDRLNSCVFMTYMLHNVNRWKTLLPKAFHRQLLLADSQSSELKSTKSHELIDALSSQVSAMTIKEEEKRDAIPTICSRTSHTYDGYSRPMHIPTVSSSRFYRGDVMSLDCSKVGIDDIDLQLALDNPVIMAFSYPHINMAEVERRLRIKRQAEIAAMPRPPSPAHVPLIKLSALRAYATIIYPDSWERETEFVQRILAQVRNKLDQIASSSHFSQIYHLVNVSVN